MNSSRTLYTIPGMNDDGNRLLMSDSLKGVVPELDEEILKQLEDATIIVALQLSGGDILSAILLGCSAEDSIVKVDFRLDTSTAFQRFSQFTSASVGCDRLLMSCGHVISQIEGPFVVKNPKITDIDAKNRNSVIGVDLFRFDP